MLSLYRVLKLRDLEIFHVGKNGEILSYVIIEDTRHPFTDKDKQIAPLCYIEDEDIDKILNVFKISIINDQKLAEEDALSIRSYFSDFVNQTNLTNFIMQEYILEDLYDNEDSIKSFNQILRRIGSNYTIEEFDEKNWIYLSQD